MRVQEAISEVTAQLKTGISYADFGKALGVSRQYIGQIKEAELSDAQIEKIEKYFEVSLTAPAPSSMLVVDYYPDVIASCGNGTYEMSQDSIKYTLPASMFKLTRRAQSYSMCHARGNSMYPRIWDGDYVICEHNDDMKINNGDMYIFCYDDEIYLKRLTKDLDRLVIESENPDFPTRFIEREDMNRVRLIGHVVGTMRV